MSNQSNRSPSASSRGRIRRSVGAGLALVGVGVLAGLVTLSMWWTPPTLSGGEDTHEIVPSNSIEQRVCPGPLRQQTNASADDAGKAVGRADIQGVIAANSNIGFVDIHSQQPVAGLADTSVGDFGHALRAAGVGGATALQGTQVRDAGALAAAQAISVDAGSTQGMALTGCDAPTYSGWLVGGSTAVGRTTLVRFVNHAAVPANVSMAMHTAGGLSGETLEPLVIRPNSERTVSLAAYAPSAGTLALSYSATGAPVTAFVQQTTVRGLAAGGVSLSNASADPTRHQVVPGIQIRDGAAQRAATDAGGFADGANVLRVVAASVGGNVKVTLVRQDGTRVEQTLRLDANEVSDMDLSNLADGTYTAYLAAAHPITAAARIAIGGTSDPQFTWVPSVEPQRGTRSVAVPPNMNAAAIMIANPNPVATKVTVTTPGGTPTNVSIDAYRNASVSVDSGAVVRVSSQSPIALALAALAGDRHSISVIPANPRLSGSIRVLP